MMKPVQTHLLLHIVMITSVLVHTIKPFKAMFDFFKEESCETTSTSFNTKGEDDVRHVNVKTAVLIELCNLRPKSVVVH